MPDAIPSYVHLLRAKDLIDRRYGEPLDVATLAAEAYASSAHFTRSFRRAFGETPYQYVVRRRVERAADLLRSTELSATEVGLEVGFATLSSFSKAFRALMGDSPSAYARRWRGAAAPAVPGCFTLMNTRPMGSGSFRQAEARRAG